MNRQFLLSGLFLLSLLLACGGGGGGGATAPPVATWATSLVYTDPTGSGFRFMKNAGLSTSSRLVLDLVGPTGQSAQGVAFILHADPAKVQWGPPPVSAGLVQSIAFDVSGPTPALVGNDKGGGTLQGAAYQKAGSQALGQPLVRICLQLKANSVSPNASVSLTFTEGNLLSNTGTVAPIGVAMGSCIVQ